VIVLLAAVSAYAVWTAARYDRAKTVYAALANPWEKLPVYVDGLGYLTCDGTCEIAGANMGLPHGKVTMRTVVMAILVHHNTYHVNKN
jgi:hypothetical protein